MDPKKLLVYASLGVGYFIYRRTLRETIISNKNLHLSSAKLSELKSNGYTRYTDSKIVIGNGANESWDPSKKERILIVGGGLIGASTAYELSKDPNKEIILFERNSDFGMETSFANGGVINASGLSPWTQKNFISLAIKSLWIKDSPLSFSWNLFTEKFASIWMLNYFFSLSEKYVAKNCERLV